MYSLSKHTLRRDLFIAYRQAARHKYRRKYVRDFNKNFKTNMEELVDDLWNRTYKPQPSTCFIITRPKKREVFAANFRDRIVHHLYFDYTHDIFERTFINDSYSCIKGKGTSFGIEQMAKHIRSESENYSKECYCLQMDVMGYFMHINRNKLLNIAIDSLSKMQTHKINKNSNKTWGDVRDFDFIFYLTKEIITLDPTRNCIIKGNKTDWSDLPASKSLFTTKNGCGLPIGNLTSQLFSNVYMNILDQFMKKVLKCKHYGRYVDDFYVVCKDKEFLHKIIPLIEGFLKSELDLNIHHGKTRITNVIYGVEFLGAFIKNGRMYISNKTLSRMYTNLNIATKSYNDKTFYNSINSCLGLLSHYDSYNIRKDLIHNNKRIQQSYDISKNYNKIIFKK